MFKWSGWNKYTRNKLNQIANGSGGGDGSSSSCFWDDPAVVEYLSAGVDARGSILNVVNQAVQANLANNLNKYLQKQTLEIRFPAAEGYSGYPFAVLPCSIFVETLESEDEVEVRFMTSAGSYTYTGFLDYIGYHDTETDSTHYDYGDVDINVIKCAIPESGSN